MKLFLNLVLVWSFGAYGAESPVELNQRYVDHWFNQAVTNHPRLKASRFRVEAATANIESIRTWENPELMVGGRLAKRSMRSDDGDVVLGVEQPLPIRGKASALRDVARSEMMVRSWEGEMAAQEIRKEIFLALIQVALVDHRLEIMDEEKRLLTDWVRLAEERYGAGRGTQAEVLRLQNELALQKNARQLETQARRQRLAQLSRQLGLEPVASWPTVRLPSLRTQWPETNQLQALTVRQSPVLKWWDEKYKQGTAQVESTRKNRLPEFVVGLETSRYSGTGQTRETMVTFSMSVPWLNDSKYRQEIVRDELEREAMVWDRSDQVLASLEMTHEFFTAWDSALHQALLYRDEMIPRSKLATESSFASWQSDKASLSDILENRRQWLLARLQFGQAVADQYKAFAELLYLTGTVHWTDFPQTSTPPHPVTKE